MLKLKNKHGFTIVELTCSIAIFCLLFLSSVTIALKSYEIQIYNTKNREYDYIMQLLKNKIQYDISYEEIKNISSSPHYYINKKNLNSNIIKESQFVDIISCTEPEELPYAVIDIDTDQVFKIKIKIKTKILNREEVKECYFFKGNYMEKNM